MLNYHRNHLQFRPRNKDLTLIGFKGDLVKIQPKVMLISSFYPSLTQVLISGKQLRVSDYEILHVNGFFTVKISYLLEMPHCT